MIASWIYLGNGTKCLAVQTYRSFKGKNKTLLEKGKDYLPHTFGVVTKVCVVELLSLFFS